MATHRRPGRAPLFLQGQDQVVQGEVSFGTARRVGRYDNLVSQLLKGRITPEEFDKTVSRWVPVRVEGGELPAGRYKFANADTALYLAESARELPQRRYHQLMHFDIQGS